MAKNSLDPASFGVSANKKGKGKGKGRKAAASPATASVVPGVKATGFFGDLISTKNVKTVAALVGGAVASELIADTITKYTANTPIAKIGANAPGAIGAAATYAIGHTKFGAPYKATLNAAAAGMALRPAADTLNGLVLKTGLFTPKPEAAPAAATSGLAIIGNIHDDDEDETGGNDDKKAARLAAKIEKARIKGKTKRLGKLEGRATKKGLDDDIARLKHHVESDDDDDDDDDDSRAVRRYRRVVVVQPAGGPAPVRRGFGRGFRRDGRPIRGARRGRG